MEFVSVLSLLTKEFKERNIRFLLIGGFALGLLGGGRNTIDLDFLVLREDLEKTDEVMKKLGYELSFQSKNVSQYSSPLRAFGGIDFLHAFREASCEMFQRGVEMKVFENKLLLPVAAPEDIIGLKLQAVANDPVRARIDESDINTLVSLYRNELNWELIEKYCSIFGREELLRELKNNKPD